MKRLLSLAATALMLPCLAFADGSAGIIESLTPAAGSTIDGFMEGSEVRVKFSSDVKPNCVWFQVQEVDFADVLTRDGDEWYHTFLIDFPMYEGADYTGMFTLYSTGYPSDANVIDTVDVTWHGKMEDPVSSSTLAQLIPEAGSTVELLEDGSFNFIVNFYEPVKELTARVMLAQGASLPAQAYPANDILTQTEGTYSWAVTLPAEAIKECVDMWDFINVVLTGIGEDGKVVYNDGLPFIGIEYYVDGEIVKGVDFSVSLEGETLSAPVQEFTVASNYGVMSATNYNIVLDDGTMVNPFESITVTDATGQIFATAESFDEAGSVVTLSAPLTITGEYTIHFPYRAFVVGEETLSDWSQEKTVSFSVQAGATSAWLFAPKLEGISNISAMQVVWGDYEVLGKGTTESYSATLSTPDGQDVIVTGRLAWAEPDEDGVGVYDMLADSDRNSLLFSFYPAYEVPGEYSLTIPAGTVLVGSVPNEEVTLTYMLTGETMNIATVITPDAEIQNSILSVQLTWDYETVTLNRNVVSDVTYTFDGIDTDRVESVDLVTFDPNEQGGIGTMTLAEDEEKGNVLVIALPFDLFGKVGRLDVKIPTGIVMNAEGIPNPPQKLEFVLLPLTTVTAGADPAPGSYIKADAEKITISWQGMEVALNKANGLRLDTASGESVNLIEEGAVEYVYSDGNDDGVKGLSLEIGKWLTADGDYAIIVSQDAFVLTDGNGEMFLNNEEVLLYNVTDTSSVAGIFANESGYTVYGIDGTLLLSGGSASDLQKLGAGLYVINGVKVLIRK